MKLQPAVFIGGVFYLAMTQALMSEFKPTLSLMVVVLVFHAMAAGLYLVIDRYQLKTEVSDKMYNHMIGKSGQTTQNQAFLDGICLSAARQAHHQQWDKILNTLTAMQKNGLKPNVYMYNSMLKGTRAPALHCRFRLMAAVFFAFQHAQMHGTHRKQRSYLEQ